MKALKIGQYIIPLWLVAVLLVSATGGVVGYYIWKTLTMQLEVKEPLEILAYPSQLSLYPGETKEFDVTIRNHASLNYSAVLDFSLNNATYQTSYVTFSDEIYTIIPGSQNITAWLTVKSSAAPINATLTINFQRVEGLSFFDDFNSITLKSEWNIVDLDGGSTFGLTAHSGWLRITTTSPPWRDLKGSSSNAPRIMLFGISGNFTVETKVMATTDENDEGAGILVWKNSHTYLRLDRMSRTIGNPVEQQILFAIEGGDWTKVTLTSNVNPTYLRLIRSGDLFSAYYSSDGINWHHVGDLTFPIEDPVEVGLDIINVYHDGTFYADFDYFRLLVED